ncbi:hypothetical protein C6A85_18330, partial [Mycobacterium sp. ITM-2017-0098]
GAVGQFGDVAVEARPALVRGTGVLVDVGQGGERGEISVQFGGNEATPTLIGSVNNKSGTAISRSLPSSERNGTVTDLSVGVSSA